MGAPFKALDEGVLVASLGFQVYTQFEIKLVSLFKCGSRAPPVGIFEVEVDEVSGEDDAHEAEADHGEVEPEVEHPQLPLDDGPVLGDLLAQPHHPVDRLVGLLGHGHDLVGLEGQVRPLFRRSAFGAADRRRRRLAR